MKTEEKNKGKKGSQFCWVAFTFDINCFSIDTSRSQIGMGVALEVTSVQVVQLFHHVNTGGFLLRTASATPVALLQIPVLLQSPLKIREQQIHSSWSRVPQRRISLVKEWEVGL
jgi:hypothetical protein